MVAFTYTLGCALRAALVKTLQRSGQRMCERPLTRKRRSKHYCAVCGGITKLRWMTIYVIKAWVVLCKSYRGWDTDDVDCRPRSNVISNASWHCCHPPQYHGIPCCQLLRSSTGENIYNHRYANSIQQQQPSYIHHEVKANAVLCAHELWPVACLYHSR